MGMQRSCLGHVVRGFRITTVQTAHKNASTDETGGISSKTVFAVGVQARSAREAGQEALCLAPTRASAGPGESTGL